MNTLQGVFMAVVTLAVFAGSALAEVDVDVHLGRPRTTVLVSPPPYVGARWVPDRIERREERVQVSPPTIQRIEQREFVQSAHIERREEQILVEPAHIERRTEQVLVDPGGVQRQYVPPVVDEAKLGPLKIRSVVREGYVQDVATPARYELVTRDVQVPARYRTVIREVEVPASYRTVYREVEIPARYEVRYRDVLIPGHYEEAVVAPPPQPVIIEQPASGIDIDLDFRKKHRRKGDDH